MLLFMVCAKGGQFAKTKRGCFSSLYGRMLQYVVALFRFGRKYCVASISREGQKKASIAQNERGRLSFLYGRMQLIQRKGTDEGVR